MSVFRWFGVDLLSKGDRDNRRRFKFRAATKGELRKYDSLLKQQDDAEGFLLSVTAVHPDGEGAWDTEYWGTTQVLLNIILQYSNHASVEATSPLMEEIADLLKDPDFPLETLACWLMNGITYQGLDGMPQEYYMKTLAGAVIIYQSITGKPASGFLQPEQEPTDDLPRSVSHQNESGMPSFGLQRTYKSTRKR